MSNKVSKVIALVKFPILLFFLTAPVVASALSMPIRDPHLVDVASYMSTSTQYHPGTSLKIVSGNLLTQSSVEARLMADEHNEHYYIGGWWLGYGYGCMSYTGSAGSFHGSMREGSWYPKGSTAQVKIDDYEHVCINGSRGFYGRDNTKLEREVFCPPNSTPVNSPELNCMVDNQPPTLYSILSETVSEGEFMAPIYLEAEDLDGVTQPTDLRYEVSGLPSWLSYDPYSGRIYAVSTPPYTESTRTSEARYTVSASVNDGELDSITRQFTITVRNENRQPSIDGDGALTVDEGATGTLTLTMSDPDTEDMNGLTVTTNAAALGNGWPSWVTVTPGAGTIGIQAQPGFGDAGNYGGLAVTVTDGGGASATHLFSVTVGDVNRPPEAVIGASSGPANATAGYTRVEFDGSESTDPDNDELTYTWDVDGTVLTGVSTSYTFPNAGTYLVTLTVSDGVLTDVSTPGMTVIVTDENPDLNYGPPICGMDPNGSNPINHATGNKYQAEPDYVGAGAFPLKLIRHYNSKKEITSSLGQKWMHSYQRHLDIDLTLSTPTIRAFRADGNVVDFYDTGVNNWVGPPGVFVGLSNSNGNWQLRFPDNVVESYDAAGRLTTITDTSGLTQTLSYVNARLDRVEDDFGRALVFGYSATSGLLESVTDPAQSQIIYGYDGDKLQSVTYQDNKQRIYHYENSNFPYALTGITDENNKRYATWRYDASGRAFQSEHAGGADYVSIDYLSPTQSRVTDAKLQARTYGFGVFNGRYLSTQLESQCSSCGGSASSTTYDDPGFAGLPNLVTDFVGNQTDYDYNSRGLQVRRTEAKGTSFERQISTSWHASYRLPECIVEPDRTTDLEYYANGQLKSKTVYDTKDGAKFTTPASKECASIAVRSDIASLNKRVWAYTYYPNGLLQTLDGPREDVNDTVTYTYHTGTDNLASIDNPLSQRITIPEYDEHGRPKRIVDANGLATKIVYTSRGWIDTVEVGNDAQGYRLTDYDHDGLGNIDYITFSDGGFLDYVYDDAHRLTDLYDNRGGHIHYELDLLGNRRITEVSDATNQILRKQESVYNLANRLEEVKNAAGARAAYYEYDDDGRLSLSTDSVNQTDYQYDNLGRLWKVIDAKVDDLGNRGETVYTYDDQDNPASVTDPKGTVTQYVHDGLGNKKSTLSQDSGTTTYPEHDGAGNVLTQIDARNKTTRFAYDALNRIDLATYDYGTAGAFSADYVYDVGANAVGRLTRINDNTGSTSWTYDLHGAVDTKTQTVGTRSFVVDYGNDAHGRLETLTYPSSKTIRFTYTNGKVSSLAVDGGQNILRNVQYDPFGPVSGWSWGNGTAVERNYDQDGRLDTYSRENATYDIDYHATGMVKDEKLAGQVGQTLSYGYDELLQVTTVAGLQSAVTYGYDANGNREQLTQGSLIYDYVVNAGSNRLDSAPGPVGKSYSYDLAGNITGDGITAFNYDARGRMSGLNELQYAYKINELGQRVAKEIPIPGNADGNGVIDTNDVAATEAQILGSGKAKGDPDCNQDGQVNVQDVVCIENLIAANPSVVKTMVYYVYDESGHLLGEYDESGAAIKEYVWFEQMPVAVLQGNQIYYVHPDHLGTPRAVTDTSDTVLWRWISDPFGAVQPNEDPDEDGNRFVLNLRFPGQYYDMESGNHYNYFRDYDPTTGRYLQSDPIGLGGGLSTYTYVGSNPLLRVDPYGLCWGGLGCIFVDDGHRSALVDGVASLFLGADVSYVDWTDTAGLQSSASPVDGVLVGPLVRLRKVAAAACPSVAKKPFALGIDDHLDDFAMRHNATTWKQFDDVENWQPQVLDKIVDPNQKVLFNLDGVDVWGGVSRSASGRGGATDWELLQIRQNPQAWDTIDFIRDGVKVENPFQ